jgi:hypothetical protein
MRGRCHDQSGSILVLFAVLLPLFMFVGMVVVDVGYWWANARKAQIAADACALAAARDLPAPSGWNRTECVQDGRDYVLTNLPPQGTGSEPEHVSTRVISPFEGNSTQVEATVRLKVRTFFGRFIGLGGVDLTRRAVAEQSVGAGDWAIYSHDPVGCTAGNGLEFDGGAGIQITGRVHSNSYYHVNSGNPASGDQFWASEGTIAATPCDPSLNPSPQGAAYGNGPEPRPYQPSDTNFEPWPTWYTPAMFNWPNCSGANFSARQINIKAGKVELKGPLAGGGDRDVNYSGNIPTGTYCATEQLTTSDSGLRGQVTLLSPQITIGGDSEFSPNQHNVLFFSVPNWLSGWGADIDPGNDGSFPNGAPFCTDPSIEMILNGGAVKWTGTIFHPCGRVLLNSASATAGSPALAGSILGYMVKVNQNDFKMTGLSDFGGTIILALDQ